MSPSRSIRLALALPLVLAGAICSSDSIGVGGDDALVFANSTGAEVTVALTHPGGAETEHVLPASTMAGEARIDVSFVAGDRYTFVLSSPSPAIAASPSTTCTVSDVAERDGVAAVLVLLDLQFGRFMGSCLTNWVES